MTLAGGVSFLRFDVLRLQMLRFSSVSCRLWCSSGAVTCRSYSSALHSGSCRTNTLPMPLASCNRSRGGAEGAPVLLILDRRDDPVTPLLSQWTYQVGW